LLIKGIIDLYEDYNNQYLIKGILKSNKFKNSYHGFHVREVEIYNKYYYKYIL